MRKTVETENAPQAIGTYSQGIIHGDVLYVSGQIPLDPKTMEMVSDDVEQQIDQVFRNLKAVCTAGGATLNSVLKLNIYLTDLSCFPKVNTIMAQYFNEPYPARAAIGVASLPKDAKVEMDATVSLTGSQ